MPSKERQGKWQPFDALEGYRNTLRNVEYEHGKIPKPILLPDALEELNFKMTYAIENNSQIILSYYESGYISKIEGIISKIDLINKLIMINSKKINFNHIVEIEIIK